MRKGRYAARIVAGLAIAVAARCEATTFAYVANFDDDTVSVVDVDTNTFVRSVVVGDGPSGLAVHPFRPQVYVGNAATAPGSLSVIDTLTRTVSGHASLPTFGSLAVHPGGTRLYVATFPTDSLLVIDTATNTITDTIPVGDFPQGVAVHPDGTRLYVANTLADTVSVIDTRTNTVTATIPVGHFPSELVVHPVGTWLYVSNSGAASVSVVDTATNAVVAAVQVGENPAGMAVHPDGKRLYVLASADSRLVVVDTVDNRVTTSVATGDDGGPLSVAVRADGTRLYVTNSNANSLVVMDTSALETVTTLAVGRYPGQIVLVERLPIDITSARVRVQRSRAARNGSMTIVGRIASVLLDDLGVGDGIAVELRAALGITERRLWASGECTTRGDRVDCGSADGTFRGVFHATPRGVRFTVRLSRLALVAPFEAPVSMTLDTGAAPLRAGGVEAVACTSSRVELRCRAF